MADKRESILDAIIANNIANIDGTGTYHNTLSSSQYSSAFKTINQIQPANMPFICLYPGRANYFPLTNMEYTSGDSQINLDGWIIVVQGYVHKSTDEQLKNDMENLVSDIIQAIETDPKLGLSAYVRNTTLKSIETYPDYTENTGLVQLAFAVKYDFVRTTP